MFDLRYHVASLAAVFVALIIGILVGVGISSGGFLRESERDLLNERIADLQEGLDAATARAGELGRAQQTGQVFIEDTYSALMAGRLTGKRVALVFVGPVDGGMRRLVERVLADTGAIPKPLRVRAVKLPVDVLALDGALARRPALAHFVGDARLGDLGRRLAQEFVLGGESPAWNAVAVQLVQERDGNDKRTADAVVVVRSVEPQQGGTARLLAGFYAGLASAGVPAVGVEVSDAAESAVPAFAKADLSTVDDLDTRSGRLALALLLAGARPGHYGLKPTAKNGLLPPVEPVPPPAQPGG